MIKCWGIWTLQHTQLLLEKETDTNAEHFAHMIPPHSLQWCLRRVTLKGFLQIGQNFTSLSAIHGTRLLSRAVKHFESFQWKPFKNNYQNWYLYCTWLVLRLFRSEEHSTLLLLTTFFTSFANNLSNNLLIITIKNKMVLRYSHILFIILIYLK